MNRFEVTLRLADSEVDLNQTPRIGRRDGDRSCFVNLCELSLEQFGGHLRLGNIVNARASAAPIGLRQLDQFQAGD